VLQKESIRPEARESVGHDFLFLREVEKESGEKVSLCYQCRKCSSGCPVAFAMDYPPDVILHMVHLGLRDRVLSSRTIWVCLSCETCTTRCPNDIDIAGVMDALRQIALREGRVAPAVREIPKFYQAFLGSIKAGGRVHEVRMLAMYMLRTNLLAKFLSGELLEQARLGWGMLRRGKLKLRPKRIRQTQEIKKLFVGRK